MRVLFDLCQVASHAPTRHSTRNIAMASNTTKKNTKASKRRESKRSSNLIKAKDVLPAAPTRYLDPDQFEDSVEWCLYQLELGLAANDHTVEQEDESLDVQRKVSV